MKKILIIYGIPLIIVLGIYLIVHNLPAKKPTPIPAPNTDTTQKPVTLVDGRQCYTFSHDATKDEPYKVSEFIDITIKGTIVTGTKRGTQSGPDMTNGYTGTISGILDQNMITDIYLYEIEGSRNQEKEIYRAGLTGIEKLRYPLVEEKGILAPDISKDFKILLYARVGCDGSN